MVAIKGQGLGVKRNTRKLIYGIGINDFEHATKVDGVLLHEYQLWSSMFQRCYSGRMPTYEDCYVEEYFHSFTNFYNFIRTLKGCNYVDENGKPFQLDKDILLKNNKCYGRDTVCFVPFNINMFLTLRSNKRGNLLLGVTQEKRKESLFYARLVIDGKLKNLGSFKTEIEAHLKYKEAKEQQAKVLAERWKDNIDERVYNALINYKVEITD